MVNRVDDSYLDDYRETNRELAKANEELKLHIKLLNDQLSEYRAIMLQKDMEIIELKSELEDMKTMEDAIEDLMIFREKYNAIVEIVTDAKTTEKITNANETLLALPQPTGRRNAPNSPRVKLSTSINNRSRGTANSQLGDIDGIDEDIEQLPGEHYSEGIEQDGEMEVNKSDKLSDIDEEDDAYVDDSLEPPEVTSVPPLVEERVFHTTSLFNCLGATPDLSKEDNQHPNPRSSQLDSDTISHHTPQKVSHRIPQEISHHNPHQTSHSQPSLQDIEMRETNGLKKISTNFNSDSPINFKISRAKANNLNMLQSTPRAQPTAQQSTICTSMERRISDNQENVQLERNQKSQNHPNKRKRQPAAAKRGAPVATPSALLSVDTSDSAPRYNLRKRSKV